MQYGVNEAGYALADNEEVINSTIGIQGWRVEVRPMSPAKTVEFLHVLQAGMGNRAAAEDAQLESTEAIHTIRIRHAGKLFALSLKRSGSRGGTLKIAEIAGGKVLDESALPDAIEDHWRYYKDDPNFRAWATDPRYRVTIEPTEEDRRVMQQSPVPR